MNMTITSIVIAALSTVLNGLVKGWRWKGLEIRGRVETI